ncbi:MAG: hypothetical protein D6712_07545 [Chloroflexi bacterium]|nr:MAG: hypothetical protein D6712_07545 [Chloroflexota bacterium]
MEATKQVLMKTQVGLRFIAMMAIYAKGDMERLRQYIAEYYTDDALASKSVEERLAEFEVAHEQVGRFRVQQLMGLSDYQAIIITETEKGGGFYMHQMQVEEEYPHKVIEYILRPVG